MTDPRSSYRTKYPNEVVADLMGIYKAATDVDNKSLETPVTADTTNVPLALQSFIIKVVNDYLESGVAPWEGFKIDDMFVDYGVSFTKYVLETEGTIIKLSSFVEVFAEQSTEGEAARRAWKTQKMACNKLAWQQAASKVTELHGRISELNEQAAIRKEEFDSVRDNLDEAWSDKKHLQEERDVVKKERDVVKKERDDLADQLKRAMTELMGKTGIIQSLQLELDGERSKNAQLQHDLDEANDILDAFEEKEKENGNSFQSALLNILENIQGESRMGDERLEFKLTGLNSNKQSSFKTPRHSRRRSPSQSHRRSRSSPPKDERERGRSNTGRSRSSPANGRRGYTPYGQGPPPSARGYDGRGFDGRGGYAQEPRFASQGFGGPDNYSQGPPPSAGRGFGGRDGYAQERPFGTPGFGAFGANTQGSASAFGGHGGSFQERSPFGQPFATSQGAFGGYGRTSEEEPYSYDGSNERGQGSDPEPFTFGGHRQGNSESNTAPPFAGGGNDGGPSFSEEGVYSDFVEELD